MKIKKLGHTVATSSKGKLDVSDENDSPSEEEEELERELADFSFEELQKALSNGFQSLYEKPNSEKKMIRDPRFESLCGTLDIDRFRKRYSFLFETELSAEREELQKLVKKSNDPKVIVEVKNHISWIDKQQKTESAKRIDAEILAEHKKKEREAAKRGKHPYYLKKSEIRERGLVEKYNNLKAAGKLESFIEKRRKNASKDHRYMPYRRSNDNENQK